MVLVPLFGWSAGDVVQSIRILYHISKVFRDASEVEGHYSQTADWLKSFAHDLERVKDFLASRPDAQCVKGIEEKLLLIDPHYKRFEDYLQKYSDLDQDLCSFPAAPPATMNTSSDPLSSTSGTSNEKRSKWKKPLRKVQWSLREMNGKVEELKRAVSSHLTSMSSLLFLQILLDLQEVQTKLSSSDLDLKLEDVRTAISNSTSRLDALQTATTDVQKAIQAQEEMIEELEKFVHKDSALVQDCLKESKDELAGMLCIMKTLESTLSQPLIQIQEQLRDADKLSSELSRSAETHQELATQIKAAQDQVSECRAQLEIVWITMHRILEKLPNSGESAGSDRSTGVNAFVMMTSVANIASMVFALGLANPRSIIGPVRINLLKMG